MTVSTIIITNILATGTAFGVLAEDNSQNVFIPAKHALPAKLYEGKRIPAMLMPNPTHADRTPWIVITFDVAHDDLMGDVGEDTTAHDILRDLEDGFATIEEVADAIGRPVDRVRAVMGELVLSGRVTRFDAYGLSEDV